MVREILVDDKAIEGSGDFTPIPEGAKLRVSIYDIEETVTGQNSKNPGQPQAMFTVKVTEEGEYKGREVKYNYLPLYPGAGNGWFLVAFAEAVGWPVNKDTKAVSVPDNLRDVLGTEVVAVFRQTLSQKINPDTQKPYVNNNVKGIRKIKGSGGITEPAGTATSWDKL